ncbi:hypothetical protein KCU65_g299, partial [Aureobasidium melanogenum]
MSAWRNNCLTDKPLLRIWMDSEFLTYCPRFCPPTLSSASRRGFDWQSLLRAVPSMGCWSLHDRSPFCLQAGGSMQMPVDSMSKLSPGTTLAHCSLPLGALLNRGQSSFGSIILCRLQPVRAIPAIVSRAVLTCPAVQKAGVCLSAAPPGANFQVQQQRRRFDGVQANQGGGSRRGDEEEGITDLQQEHF